MKKLIIEVLSNEPGLTGREIAKRINREKKEVNSFLSKNKDSFSQNEDYQWFLETREIEIKFPDGWIDARDYEDVLVHLPDLFATSGSIRFTLPKGCKPLIETISRFLALLNQLAYEEIEVVVDLAECAETRSFLGRAGFYDLLSKRVKILPKRPKISAAKIYEGNSDSLVEIGAICPTSTNKGLVKALRSNFVAMSSEVYDTVALTVFSEFINNVKDHSKSPIDGFAALQSYAPYYRKKHIQTVISDSGLGVVSTLRGTLAEHYPALNKRFPDDGVESDIGLVLEVFSKGNITRHGKESGRGLGFESTRKQASKFDADLSIRVDTFEVKLKYRNGTLSEPKINRGLTKMRGTHICFDFYVD